MSDLGRIQLHDPKSRDYEFRVRRDARQISVRHRMDAPNVDQFYTSGCVGFSGANMLNCAAAVRSRSKFNSLFIRQRNLYLTNTEALTNYSYATKFDPFDWVYPPTDEGSSALGLMKWWHRLGVITGYDWCFTFDQFLAALQRQPVLVGTEWFEDMNAPFSTGLALCGGASRGGHEYLATGIRYDRRWIRFENSWGENWGDHGGFYLHFEAVRLLLADGGDVAVPRFL